jgi:hypothetical protein
MEPTAHGPVPIRHSFLHEKGIFKFSWLSGALIFLALSGLAIWLAPFSVATEVSVLVHAALGVVILIPLTLWQASHWLATRKVRRSFRKFCAYTGFWTMAVTTVSGVVLTWQAAFTLFTSHFWDRVHLWSGIAALPFLAYHVYPHAKKANNGLNTTNGQPDFVPPDFRPGRRHMWAMAGATVALLVILVGGLTVAYDAYAPDFSHYKLPAGYKMPYGKDPFAPSMAMTASGGPVAPQLLAGSKSCGASGCHTEIYDEWRSSPHRWSSEDKFFQAVQAALIHAEGAPATRYCAGCHDPVSLLSGYKNASTSIEAPGFKEGSSCVACHSMQRVDVQGNGNYVWAPPEPYLFEYKNAGEATLLTHFLIRAYPKQHDTDYNLTLVKNPVSCASCHKQFINKQINHVGFVQLQNQYDEWRLGKWNANPNPADRLRCQQCHMWLTKAPSVALADPYDLKHGRGLEIRNHWFAAANQVMPAMLHVYGWRAQTARVLQWLKGEKYVPEIAKIWPKGPVIPLRVIAPPSIRPGQQADVRVVLTNNKAGHGFATGPLDLIRAWVAVEVRDAKGRVIYHSGQLTAQNHVEPGTLVLRAIGVNPEGKPVVRHHLWHYVGTISRRAIFPGYSDMYEYKFTVPAHVQGPLQVAAQLRYRKANQYFMNFVFPGQFVKAPVTTMSSGTAEIALLSSSRPRGRAAVQSAPRSARRSLKPKESAVLSFRRGRR